MFHPDNCQVYDAWVPIETMWYDDAKMHRYAAHHPMNCGTYENHERFGDLYEISHGFKTPTLFFFVCLHLYCILVFCAAFHTEGEDDPMFEEMNKYYDINLRQTIEQEERRLRGRYVTSYLGHNWEQIVGMAYPKTGDIKWWVANVDTSRDLDWDPVHKGTPS
jgi:hypothetical protein